jgi:hypothetical protein
MQDADNLNTIRKWQVKHQIAANRATSQTGQEFIPAGAKPGELRKESTPVVNRIKDPVSRIRVILRDRPPEIVKINLCLRAFEHPWH